jgi:hypothetical protein
MAKRLIRAAIAYDFDGTLAPGNIQEYDFIPSVNTSSASFWSEVKSLAHDQQADEILCYMFLMLEKARSARIPVRREDFANYGRSVALFDGVDGWFKRINEYARSKDINLEHYIISSAIKEMVEATEIGKHVARVFASSFMYDHHGIANWPALAINYTTKTQYLFRINKGSLDVADHSKINAYVKPAERPIPFTRMVFIGDGSTDIPCMKLVREQCGHSIAVYKPKTKGARNKAQKLIAEDRVNFVAPADYREGEEIDGIVKRILDKIATDAALEQQ